MHIRSQKADIAKAVMAEAEAKCANITVSGNPHRNRVKIRHGWTVEWDRRRTVQIPDGALEVLAAVKLDEALHAVAVHALDVRVRRRAALAEEVLRPGQTDRVVARAAEKNAAHNARAPIASSASDLIQPEAVTLNSAFGKPLPMLALDPSALR